MIDHGQSVTAWAEGEKSLTAEDRAALLSLIHVRTVGDLQTALERDELPKALAKKLEKALSEK